MALVEYLDPEIANEGQKALGPMNDDGSWTPGEEYQVFMDPPVVPDYAFVKQKGMESLRKLFPQHSGVPYRHQAFPTWAYHATEKPRLLRTEQHGKEHGMAFNRKTFKFDCSGEWSDVPVKEPKFDPKNPGMGKSIGSERADPAAAQSTLVAAVVAAVIAQMTPKGSGNALAAAPSAAGDDADYKAFKAWQASLKPKEAPISLTPAEEKETLLKIAAEADVKIDKRWSLDRIKEELDKVSGD